jgi:O-antigen ligase
MTLDRVRLAALADYLAAAVVVSLPWSTSVTSILTALWAITAATMLDGTALRRMAATPVAALPVALAGLAVAGMLWSEADWPARLSGLSPFLKLLAIPLLFVQFSRSGRSEMVLNAFFASVCVLLVSSWLLYLLPQIPWKTEFPGVPAKDYIIQNLEFILCSFALLDRALAAWAQSRVRSLLLAGLALLFLGDIVFVALGRTSVFVIIVLFGLLALRHFERWALAAFVAAGVLIAALAWTAATNLRSRVTHLAAELDSAHVNLNETSAGLRVGFWRMSVRIIGDAPLFGHGTGAIKTMFTRTADADPAAPKGATNPHNQILATAIQFGLLGVAVLLAMWVCHFRLFLLPGPTAWTGLSVVAANIVGSLFNSHLSDFSQGWLYVFGIGIAGGVILHKRQVVEGRPRADESAAAVPLLEPAAGPAE